jgi:hypothetical protein
MTNPLNLAEWVPQASPALREFADRIVSSLAISEIAAVEGVCVAGKRIRGFVNAKPAEEAQIRQIAIECGIDLPL